MEPYATDVAIEVTKNEDIKAPPEKREEGVPDGVPINEDSKQFVEESKEMIIERRVYNYITILEKFERNT